MPENSPAFSKQDFINLFNQVAQHKHRFDVFRDFVTMAAISLHNGICKDDQLESEYLKIINCYDRENIDRLAAFMCYVQLTLWNIPAQIVVGDTLAYQEREIYYTPSPLLGLVG